MPAETTPSVLNLGTTLNIEKASILKKDIASALAGGHSVDIVFSGVEELDLSCIQVLYAALRQAKSEEKELHFVGALSKSVAERLKRCGFIGEAHGEAGQLEAALAHL
jgi:anti-anti-sigma regulatory factor